MIVGLLALVPSVPALYCSCLLVGFGFGAVWTLTPTIASALFGEANLGANYKALVTASPIGSLCLSTALTGVLYDRQPLSNGNNNICGVDINPQALNKLLGLQSME